MRTSYSKIRHIQESNIILEKRLLKESISQSSIETGATDIMDCFDSKKYPNLDAASHGSAKVVFGLLLMWGGVAGELLSFGLSTVPSIAVGVAGVASTTVGLKKIYDANISKIDNELKSLWDCVF